MVRACGTRSLMAIVGESAGKDGKRAVTKGSKNFWIYGRNDGSYSLRALRL